MSVTFINVFRLFLGNSTIPPSTMDKSKDWQLEILMEKLRSKASQFKSLTEISKNVRMTMLVGYVICDNILIYFNILMEFKHVCS